MVRPSGQARPTSGNKDTILLRPSCKKEPQKRPVSAEWSCPGCSGSKARRLRGPAHGRGAVGLGLRRRAQLVERAPRKRSLEGGGKTASQSRFSASLLDSRPLMTDADSYGLRIHRSSGRPEAKNREPTRGVEPRTPRLRSECSGHLSYVGGCSTHPIDARANR